MGFTRVNSPFFLRHFSNKYKVRRGDRGCKITQKVLLKKLFGSEKENIISMTKIKCQTVVLCFIKR